MGIILDIWKPFPAESYSNHPAISTGQTRTIWNNTGKKLFGTKSERNIKKIEPLVEEVKKLEESYQRLSEDELKAKTDEFRKRLSEGESTDDIKLDLNRCVL